MWNKLYQCLLKIKLPKMDKELFIQIEEQNNLNKIQ